MGTMNTAANNQGATMNTIASTDTDQRILMNQALSERYAVTLREHWDTDDIDGTLVDTTDKEYATEKAALAAGAALLNKALADIDRDRIAAELPALEWTLNSDGTEATLPEEYGGYRLAVDTFATFR